MTSLFDRYIAETMTAADRRNAGIGFRALQILPLEPARPPRWRRALAFTVVALGAAALELVILFAIIVGPVWS